MSFQTHRIFHPCNTRARNERMVIATAKQMKTKNVANGVKGDAGTRRSMGTHNNLTAIPRMTSTNQVWRSVFLAIRHFYCTFSNTRARLSYDFNTSKKPFIDLFHVLFWTALIETAILPQNRHFQRNKWPSGVFCTPELLSLFMQMNSVSYTEYITSFVTPHEWAPPPPSRLSMGAAKFLLRVSLATTSQLALIYFLSLVAMPTPCEEAPSAGMHDGDKL